MTDIDKLNDKTLEIARQLLVAQVEKTGLGAIRNVDVDVAYTIALQLTSKVYGN